MMLILYATVILHYFCDGSMRKDNIEEWMFQYFEKLIKINE